MNITLFQESRADAGIYQPLIEAMKQDKRFELSVVHARPWLGEKGSERTDWLIVLGDRRPMLEATIDAAYRGIPVAHIQGGDRSGTIDEPCRHAITRFANLHFPCTQASADRLIRMGEEPWRIQVVGPLGIYAMKDAHLLSITDICSKLDLDASREIVLVIQHPVSTQVEDAQCQMIQTLAAVREYQTVAIYPNSDPGSIGMEREIEAEQRLREKPDTFHVFKNLPYLDFISLLRASSVVVGNSSTGLYEAPLFGVPAVDIGDRQTNRERPRGTRHTRHDSDLIRNEIMWALAKGKRHRSNPFDVQVDGVKIIMDTLWGTEVNERLMQKRLVW